ncbi:MAG: (2Fe-2S)-binding protein [Vicinamibacterales bacterium]
MADTSSTQPGGHSRSHACPSNGAVSHAIAPRTVKALLTMDALGRLSNRPHFFCSDPACDTVYFDDAGVCFVRRDVRVPVYQKEPPGGRLLCYCFGESEEGILLEVATTGRSEAAARVRRHIAAGRCACDLRNPKGTCCLGEVVRAVKAAENLSSSS